MPRTRLSNYLRTARLRSGFSQRALAELFGVSRSVITKAEGVRSFRIEQLLMAEIVFGLSKRELFPDQFERLERLLLKRALVMEHRLMGLDDAISCRKRAFLNALIERVQANNRRP